MITILSTLVSLFSFRLRSRASLELELIAPAASPPPSAVLHRPFVLGVALPRTASTPRYLGTRQIGDRDRMASQGLPHLQAMAITPFWTIEDECGNPRPDAADELCQRSLGRASHPWRIAQARRRCQPSHSREVSAAAPQDSLPDLAQLSAQPPD